MIKKREDIELLAGALCKAYNDGSDTMSQPEHWIPTAEKLANDIYGQLLETCQLAYRKHVMSDESIGWESLGDKLNMALVSVMGDEEYNKWINSLDKTEHE
jgi:hypothetical protein